MTGLRLTISGGTKPRIELELALAAMKSQVRTEPICGVS